MITIINFIIRKSSFGLILMLALSNHASACGLYSIGEGSLFDSDFKKHTERLIIQGPIIEQEVDTKEFTRGFRPSKSLSLAGTYCEEVYDFGPEKSVYEIFHILRKNQKDAGFEVGFECAGIECGETAGWQLLLSKHVNGEPEDQRFLMTYFGTSEFYIASNMIHVTEFDGQPRLTITSIYSPDAVRLSLFDSNVGLNHADLFKLTEIGTLYFASNKANGYRPLELEKIVAKINGDQPNAKYLIIGYADVDGTKESNQKLSLVRADSVLQQLVSSYKLDEKRFYAVGKGELTVAKAASSQARKVVVYRIPGG
jgi:flagellar motor protein MotB